MSTVPRSAPWEARNLSRQAPRAAQSAYDLGMILGVAIAALALAAGIAVTGIGARYFLQPAGLLIVAGGTFGIMLITTPPAALGLALRRAARLFNAPPLGDAGALIEEIASYAKMARIEGLLAIEPVIGRASCEFLREALLVAMDAKQRPQLQTTLENKARSLEKQSETAARTLETAGGFAPAIGILGTVVALIDILRQFTGLTEMASGVGAAFTSTIYGLALANLALLPAAHRIRARAAETADLHELMIEGTLCIFDDMHPRLVRQRLHSLVGETAPRRRAAAALESALESGQS